MPRETRNHGRGEDRAPAPWPRGLLVEAPPSPKPWRGRTWSSDSWRTTHTSSLTAEDSSSQESVDWNGIGGGLVGDSSLLQYATMRRDLASFGNHSNYSVIGSGSTLESGGVTAMSNGESGGGHVVETTQSDADNRHAGKGAGMPRDAGGKIVMEGSSERDAMDGGNGAAATTMSEGGYTGRPVVGVGLQHEQQQQLQQQRDLPPLAPIPRAGAFREQRRAYGSGGRKAEVRTVAFAPCPVELVPPRVRAPVLAADRAMDGDVSSQKHSPSHAADCEGGRVFGAARDPEEQGRYRGVTGNAERGHEEDDVVRRMGDSVIRNDEGHDAVDVGHIVVEGVTAVKAVLPRESEKDFGPTVSGDVGVTKVRIISCPVKVTSPKFVVRQWRSSFFP